MNEWRVAGSTSAFIGQNFNSFFSLIIYGTSSERLGWGVNVFCVPVMPLFELTFTSIRVNLNYSLASPSEIISSYI